MIYALLANGFEEVEAFAPIDILRRAGLTVKTVGIGGAEITGSHGIAVKADILPEEATDKIDLLFLPGGMPGSKNLDESPAVDALIARARDEGAHIAAICAAPLVLGHRGLLEGRRAVCYPGFEAELRGAKIVRGARVVTDGNITTAVGMGAACELGLTLAAILTDRETAEKIANSAFIDASRVSYPQKPYEYPSVSLLHEEEVWEDGDIAEETASTIAVLDETMDAYGINAHVASYTRGPRVTLYEVEVSPKTRVRKIAELVDDFSIKLTTYGIRVIAPLPGKAAVGIEVPNRTPAAVRLRTLLDAPAFQNAESKTTVCLGTDTAGEPVYCDIAKMPHLLIGGATGMGKSVCINSILTSLLYKASPDEVKLILIDPKKVEFPIFSGLPHLLVPVITDPRMAVGALYWTVGEMERRFDLFESCGARDLKGYMRLYEEGQVEEPLARLVIVIDELHDLMLCARDETESAIARITAKARAAGIHLIIATQRPTSNIVTGLVKNNIPTRIAFRVSSGVDSRTLLDLRGAEQLLGQGDMLYMPVGGSPVRVQGAFVDESEVERVVESIKRNEAPTDLSYQVINGIKQEMDKLFLRASLFDGSDTDFPATQTEEEPFNELMLRALEIALEMGKLSTSLLQRKLKIGYGKAAKLVDTLCENGYIGESNGAKPREVLITREEFNRLLAEFEEE